MIRAFSLSPFGSPVRSAQRLVVNMSAAATTRSMAFHSLPMAVKLPAHPTYDLKSVIQLALSEDAGDLGDVTCKATIPVEMEVEAYFLAKEDGIVAGIGLAEMVFNEVDPSLKVEWYRKDGDNVHKGLQFGKVHEDGWNSDSNQGHGGCCTPCVHFRDPQNCSWLEIRG